MDNFHLFSRRNADKKVDFRPEPVLGSPSYQLRRLAWYYGQDISGDDIEDCPDALRYLREYVYRKTFTGTTHEQFLETDKNDPEAIDWLLAVASVESSNFRSKANK